MDYWLKGKISDKRKKVTQKTLDGDIIKIWDSILEVEKSTNSRSSKIVLCCQGERKTHNKFIWEYYL